MIMITLFPLQLTCIVRTAGSVTFFQQAVLQQITEQATHSSERTVNISKFDILSKNWLGPGRLFVMF